MESNNPNLGDDVRVEELAPEPEHTTAETQGTPELTVENTEIQAERLEENVVDEETPAPFDEVNAEPDVEEEAPAAFDEVIAEQARRRRSPSGVRRSRC